MLRIVSDVELGERLPQLISSLELAAREPAGGPGGFVALAEGYQVTAAAMAKLHQTDVASIAADRAVTAAERAGDALLAAVGDFRLAHAFLPQLDVRAIPDAEDTRGGPTGSPLRRQYATKSSDGKGALDHRLRTADEIAGLDVNDHLRRFVSTALDPRAVDVRRLETVVSADNTASIRLLSRVGRAQVHPPGGTCDVTVDITGRTE
jgi:hypothetical protein